MIPFGSWELGSGVWHHNPSIKLSPAQQHEHNVKFGYSCSHGLNPVCCSKCGGKRYDASRLVAS